MPRRASHRGAGRRVGAIHRSGRPVVTPSQELPPRCRESVRGGHVARAAPVKSASLQHASPAEDRLATPMWGTRAVSETGWRRLRAPGMECAKRTPLRLQTSVRRLLLVHHSTAGAEAAANRLRNLYEQRSFSLRNAWRTGCCWA